VANLPFLTPEDVAEIVAILDATPYARIDIRTEKMTLQVARSGDGWTQEWQYAALPIGAPSGLWAPAAQLGANAALDSNFTDVEGLTSIRPPLPGTFYRAPQPGAPNFVEIGDVITADTIIGIIETMKVMNAVPAGIAGEVEEIVTPNGTMISKNDVLIRLRIANS
jgi:acetyl-CoA carboxylase biotin carboxyl carrier protein